VKEEEIIPEDRCFIKDVRFHNTQCRKSEGANIDSADGLEEEEEEKQPDISRQNLVSRKTMACRKMDSLNQSKIIQAKKTLLGNMGNRGRRAGRIF